MFVMKLDSSGQYQWHTFHGCPDLFCSTGNSISLDGYGNIYVTGLSMQSWNGPSEKAPLHASSGGMEEIFLLKLSSSGEYQWHTFYGSSRTINPWCEEGKAVATDILGNVYVIGRTCETWNGPDGESPLNTYSANDDIFVLKLNGMGEYQWHTFFGSFSGEYANKAALDSSGNIYVTGYSVNWNGPGGKAPSNTYQGGFDVFVLKLNSSGQYQWHTFYGSVNEDCGNAITLDSSGSVYVTGYSQQTWDGPGKEAPIYAHSGLNDIFLLKLGSGGEYQWHTFYGSESDDYGNGLIVDSLGNIYVTGYVGFDSNHIFVSKVSISDATAPFLSINSHTAGQRVSTAKITLWGMANDKGKGNSGIQQVTIDGVRASNDAAAGTGTAYWSKSVTLSRGKNEITVTAYDNSIVHNSTTKTITVHYEMIPAFLPELFLMLDE